ncbi:MAG: A-macroglobulin complement [Planctomycetota bacterium]|nr:MAG: A-macroglobulin complement [Planctomycetota bacterium]
MKRAAVALVAACLAISSALADWPAEKAAFKAAFTAESPVERACAVKALRDFDHPEGMALLLESYSSEKDSEVRQALADVMNAVTNVRARDVFRDTILKHPDAPTRARYCALFADGRMLDRFEMLRFLLRDASELVRARALRNLGPSDAALAADAAKLVEDPVADVRMAACGALGNVKSDEGVPALVKAVEMEKLAEIKWAAGDALGKISGQAYGEDAALWKKWWTERRFAAMSPVEKALWKGGEFLKPRFRTLLEAYEKAEASPVAGGESMRVFAARPISLVTYAMLHAGVPPDDPDMKAGIELLERMPLSQTYDVALAAMALADHDPKAHRERLAEIAQWLVDQQCVNGQWSYGAWFAQNQPSKPKKEKKSATPPEKTGSGTTAEIQKIPVTWKDAIVRVPSGDNSNTQYALLGLRACLSAAEIPKASWQRSLAWFRRTQTGDGSWHYGSVGFPGKLPGWGSMTAGGVSSLVICMRALGMDDELQPDKLKTQKEIRAAMEWMGANFSVVANPKCGTYVYYWLYAVERAGMIMGVAEFGKHDWYKEGSEMLLKAQAEDGSWKCATDPMADTDNDTCFAILFLRKATKGYTVTGPGKK